MIYPFNVSTYCHNLKNIHYPPLSLLHGLKENLTSQEMKDFLKLYFTEGIPFAFKQNPIIFEQMKGWLSKQIDVDSKQITIIGSARIGLSLNPKKWGKPFSDHSDLDFIIVNFELFKKYIADFQLYAEHINDKLKKRIPIRQIELANIETMANTIDRGFIDSNKIPNDGKYITGHKLYDVLSHLLKRLNKTENCPHPRDASIRIYKDWNACTEQLYKNYNFAFKLKIMENQGTLPILKVPQPFI